MLQSCAQYDLRIRRGDTFSRTFTFKDALGDIVPLNGSTVRMTFETTSTDLVKNYTGDDTGQVTLVLSSTETNSFKPRAEGTYKVQRVTLLETVTLMEGRIIMYGGDQDASF